MACVFHLSYCFLHFKSKLSRKSKPEPQVFETGLLATMLQEHLSKMPRKRVCISKTNKKTFLFEIQSIKLPNRLVKMRRPILSSRSTGTSMEMDTL